MLTVADSVIEDVVSYAIDPTEAVFLLGSVEAIPTRDGLFLASVRLCWKLCRWL